MCRAVSPGHLNRSAGWLMEGLVELCEAIGPASEHLAYVYRLEGAVPIGTDTFKILSILLFE